MNNAVQILRLERDKANEQIKALRVRLRELDAAINLLENQVTEPSKSGNRGKDMKSLVVEVIDAAGAGGLLIKDVLTELSKRGKDTTEASLASTLSRLKNEQKVKNDRGMWIGAGFGNLEENPGDAYDYSDYAYDDPSNPDDDILDL